MGVPSTATREAIRAEERTNWRGVSEDGVTATRFEREIDEEAGGTLAVGELCFGLGVIVLVHLSDPANDVLRCMAADRTLPAAVGARGFERSKL